MPDYDRDLETRRVLNTIADNIRIRASRTPPPTCDTSTRLVAEIVFDELARAVGGERLSENCGILTE
jgi:hypothetical protein